MSAVTLDGETPLHYATASGQTEAATLLLQAGANVNQTSYDGYSPLHLASQGNHLETVKLLLHSGAERDILSNFDESPLYLAAKWRALDVIDEVAVSVAELEQKVDGETMLFQAAKDGEIEVVKKLLQLGANPNSPSLGSVMPLHIAAKFGHLEIIEELLNGGANVDGKCKNEIDLKDNNDEAQTTIDYDNNKDNSTSGNEDESKDDNDDSEDNGYDSEDLSTLSDYYPAGIACAFGYKNILEMLLKVL